MFTAPNPGPKTLEGTHTYVVGAGPAHIIDPGPDDPGYAEALARWTRASGVSVAAILVSHAHPDHARGAGRLASLLGATVWVSEAADVDVMGTVERIRRFGSASSFPVDGDTLEVIPGPGHSPDHHAFWLSSARVLFSGDTILGHGTSLVHPPEGNMREYMRTLEQMRHLRPRVILPGHGPIIIDPESKIREYIEHRRGREDQVLARLTRGPADLAQLAASIYSDIDPRLAEMATGSLQGTLEKLIEDGLVEQSGTFYTLVKR